MNTLKIIIIRHAEKPGEGGEPPFGVSEEGRPDPRRLSPLGWQRAGALVAWFGRPSGDAIRTPATLFAPDPHGTSHRAHETLAPLGRFLRLPVHADLPVGEEAALARAVLAAAGPVLIAWEHKALPRLAKLLAGDALRCPPEWPSDRFDLAWVLDRDAADRWRFSQVPQLLLSGDSPALLPVG